MVPERELPRILHELGRRTHDNTARRQLAVRWFNRLYYDVRRWNEDFIAFLRPFRCRRDARPSRFLNVLRSTVRRFAGTGVP